MVKQSGFKEEAPSASIKTIDAQLSSEVVAARELMDQVFKVYTTFIDNLLKIFQDLHPDESGTKMEDIYNETVKTILTKFPANDLAFSVRDDHLILIEHQSKWSPHIVLRLFVYSALVLLSYLIRKHLDISNLPADWKPPAIECYVVYTGERKEVPKELLYSDLYFDGEKTGLDFRVKVLYKEDRTTLGQFNAFGARWREIRKQHPDSPYSAAVVQELIDVCIRDDIMKEFLESERIMLEKTLLELYNREREIEALTRQREALAQEKEDKAVKEAVEIAVEKAVEKTKIEENKKMLLELVDEGILSWKEAEDRAKKKGFSLNLNA